jgi:hypothetical protein
MTFSILVLALTSLFATDPILGNQHLAANAGGSFGDGGGLIIGGGSCIRRFKKKKYF